MKSYCLKFRKDTENINPKVSGTSNGKAMILSKCAICGSKKSRFIKNQEAKGLLRQGGLASMVYNFFDKKAAGSSVNIDANKSAFNNEKLAEELHKPIISKF